MAGRVNASQPSLALRQHTTSSPYLACGHPRLVIGNQHRPLRLIDISATLACGGGIIFTAKQDWDFHVISHTWSLSIREFSEEVGRSLAGSRTSHAGHGQQADQYNKAFSSADFSAKDGYKDLLKFLRILKEDGVKNVWFDALCINQTDEDEKGKEIMHMGAFYRYSAGCYVVHHGIGKGYDLLGWDEEKNEVCLPRWFTRVWTLQEFVLPTNLFFLVSRLGREIILRVNEQIKEHRAAGFCNCCLRGKWTHYYCKCCTLPYWLCCNRRGDDENGEDILGSGDDLVMCNRCKALPLIRRAKGCGDYGEVLYFVERSAYQRLVSLHDIRRAKGWGAIQLPPWRFRPEREILGTSRVRLPSTAALPHFNFKSWHLHFSQLYRLLASKCFQCDTTLYATLIKSRNCSRKHEEDRVLSVLCLLGLEGSMQVRTGQTLEQQWVEVAEQLREKGRSKQLLDLCIQDIKFSWQVASSWIPNYCEFDTAHWLSMIRLQSESVHVKEVTKAGVLRLEGMVVPARLLRQELRWKEHKSSDPLAMASCSSCQHFSSVHNTWSRMHQQAMCHLEVDHYLCIPLIANACMEETQIGRCIARRHACVIQSYPYVSCSDACLDCDQIFEGALHLPLACMHGLRPLDVFMVLWGGSQHEKYSSMLGAHSFGEQVASSSVVMVCVGRTGTSAGHQLHKIGVLDLPSDVVNAIFFHSSLPSSEFLLGGFGSDILQLWDTLAHIHGVRCGFYPFKKHGLQPLQQEYVKHNTKAEIIVNVTSQLVNPIVTIL